MFDPCPVGLALFQLRVHLLQVLFGIVGLDLALVFKGVVVEIGSCGELFHQGDDFALIFKQLNNVGFYFVDLVDLALPLCLKVIHEVLHFLVSLVENLVLLLVLFLVLLVVHFGLQVPNFLLVVLDVLFGLLDLLVDLLDVVVVLLHPGQQPVSGLWETEVGFVQLQFQLAFLVLVFFDLLL